MSKIVKQIKSAESSISMVLGIVVVVVTGVLLFNYFKGVSSPKTSTQEQETPTGSPVTGAPFKGSLPTTYTVVKGDNLWKISLNFYGSGFNWVDISSENNVKNSNVLLVGQVLNIPNVPERKPIVQKMTNDSLTLKPISENSYTVAKGDSLWNISVRAYQDGFKWQEIAKANKEISNPSLIHPGNVLVIPR